MARGMATMAVVESSADAGPTSTPATGTPAAAVPADAVTAAVAPTGTPAARSGDPGVATAPLVAAPTAAVAPVAAPAGPAVVPTPADGAARPRPRPRPAPSPEPAGPSWGAPAAERTSGVPAVDPAEAEEFLRQFFAEAEEPGATTVKGEAAAEVTLEERIAAVRDEIARTGTYVHTTAELTFGARVAWRNSARCIGRLYWRSLHLRDRRHVSAPDEVAAECVGHLDEATRRGRIRSTITIFAPDTPTAPGPRIWNEQLIRYAGYRTGGRVLGDPRHVGFTDHARSLGWVPPSPMGRFDVLPLVVSGGGEWAEKGPQFVEVPAESVLEVDLHHPDHSWFADLGLRWHALPVISNMRLDIGGVSYPAAPFNGWYMATEIGARNLADADRYDMLREVAEKMGLDTSSDRTMWRDRAAVELTLAVQHSFDVAGVSMADHHGESERFLRHLEREEQAGRSCPVDWSWIVPPISGGLTPVFHRYYDEPTDTGPMFRVDPQAAARGSGCPI
ncbi:nitric oxide synthase oxygenase [Actinomycetospora soli]|uniref:nitric oxide synthase oxygenase n=1 Tax=Actinomycetospora soli TaxID=2893887 RepID=UPI0021076EEB|nr:nitric oxide synthase oxygenase [Actinomycetospora soli]